MKNYRYTLIDSPAGLEHLNRKIISQVDAIFNVLDPSKKAFQHVKRAHKILKELNIAFEHFYLIGGHEFPEELGKRVEKEMELKSLGKIAFDKAVKEYMLEERFLLTRPSDSSAYLSVRKIMEKAGYISLKRPLSLE